MPRKRTIHALICGRCGEPFQASVFAGNRPRMYCSSACRYGPVPDRLWDGVERGSGCWLRTTVCPHRDGYTKLRIGKRRVFAHRAAWEEATGEVLTDDYSICHTCDEPPCIRNDDVGIYEVDGAVYPRRGHLFKAPGQLANVRDKITKGRLNPARGEQHGSVTKPDRMPRGDRHGSHTKPEALPRGEQHGNSKLTADQVRAIRARYAQGGITQQVLAAEYGVDFSNISCLVRGKSWKHIL